MKTPFLLLVWLCLFSNQVQAQAWQQQNPNFSSSTFIQEVVAPTSSAAWAYGFVYDSTGNFTYRNYSVSRTADGGESWQNLAFPHTEPGYFSNLSALSAEVAWLAYVDYANGQKILNTTDGGQSWTEQSHGMTAWINFVHFFDNAAGLAMGDPDAQGFGLFTSSNGGAFWERVAPANVPPPLSGEFGWASFYEVSDNKVWFETNQGRVYFSPNQGHSWEVFEGPLGTQPYSMFAADDAGMCYMSYVAAEPNGLNPVLTLYRTPDNGLSWENITPTDNGWWIYDIEPVPGTGAIVAEFNRGFASRIFETRLSYDQGTTWQTIDAGAFVTTMDFSGPDAGFAAGWQPIADTSHVDVYRYTGSPLTGLFERKPLNVNFSAYPNPASDFIRVQLESPEEQEWLLLLNDANGRLLYKEVIEKTNHWNTTLGLQPLPTGWYTLTVSTAKGVATRKVLKR